jgi:nicotinamide mononucleotide adenylyltransferase
MKTFLQFLSEATATMQAARLGLQGDGHGGWYKDGEFVAKTVRGQLKFYNKRQQIPGKDPAQTELEKNIADPNFQDPAIAQQQPVEQLPPEQQEVPQEPMQQEVPPQNFLPVEKTKGTLTIAFGRFNPPHLGHLQLMDTAAASAEQEGSDYMIVPSRSQDKKKNPLDADTKVSIMRQMFPQHSERIANDPNNRTIFDILKKAHNDGYANVRIVGGADRVKEFDKLANNYNNNLYQFDNIEVVSAGDRDPDAEGVEGLSASRMRLAAAEGDFKTFRAGMPPEMRPKDARAIFDTVRASMGIQDEVMEVWQIAPKFDAKTLRENYLTEKIFRVGDLVENMNTGLIGRIIRRGTNYLICVTEDSIMFKSWIKDVTEAKKYTEKKMNSMYREKGKPNTLVGTLGYFKYADKQTPGALGVGKGNLQPGGISYGIEFINRHRKR